MAEHGSRHFALHEFACPHCGVSLVRPRLLATLEVLRMNIGRPIPILSGYRCPVHNFEISGASDSQHMYGAAADLQAGLASLSVARSCGFTGVGTKNGQAVHVDVRDGPFVTWQY